MLEDGRELFDNLRAMPRDLRELLEQAKQGRIKLEVEPTGVQGALVLLDQVSNRLAFAIVLASLVIGSAIVVGADITLWGVGIPLGVMGFFVAGLMGFWLLTSIIRHGMI